MNDSLSGEARREPSFATDALRIARKDLLIEFRTRSAFLAATVFAVLAIAIFRFSWDPTAIPAIDLAPGVLWVIFTFSGLLGLNRSFSLELSERAYDGLLASQVSREAVFAGKMIANLAFVSALQVLAMPVLVLFFDLPVGSAWPVLIVIVLLAAVGLSAVGTLFAAIAANTRMADLLLPMMTLPFFVPLVIPAAQASAIVLRGLPASSAADWLKLLLAFDILFVAACLAVFPFTIEE